MKPYFESSIMRERLFHHAGKWFGTPFAPHQRVCGAGVDCVNLVAAIYMQCDFLGAFDPPPYSMDGGKHNESSQLLAWLDSHPRFMRVEDSQPGDVLCFRFRSQTEHHVGLKLIGPGFIHCLARRRVEMATLNDSTYRKTLSAIYRPVI